MKRILVPLLILALVCLCLPGLAEGNAIRFDRSVNRVFVGETLQTVLTREGACAEGDLAWTTSNPKVATVDDQGIVTGVSKGQATITVAVQAAGKTYRAQLTVTVAVKATEVQIATSKLPVYDPADPLISGLLKTRESDEENALPVLVLPVKKSYNLQATVLPKEASNRKVVFTSSDESVAHVRGTSVSGQAPGEAILTVANEASPEVSVRYRVLVIQPVTRVSPSVSSPTVAVGGQVTLSATVMPEDASIPKIVWSSADERIATVDENGVVTGVKRGTARLVAATQDGSSVRANVSVKVEQNATGITLNTQELTVDAGRTAVLRATVLPQDTNNKAILWSSSDESVATVNKAGRISAIALGTCEITCTSQSSPDVKIVATVHVQQPVKKITFDAPIVVYMGETAKLSWTVEPDNASNPTIKLSSQNTHILNVDQDGTVTPVKLGQTYVNAVSTDGSNRRARVLVKVLQHVEGVTMKRQTAYIDVKEAAMTAAEIYPANASNKNMFWETADPGIVSVTGQRDRVRLVGVSRGDTVVTGTTEDGGFKASINVRVGDWDHALRLTRFDFNRKGQFYLDVTNRSDLWITSITAKITFYEVEDDGELEPIPVNTRDGSNEITAIWQYPLGEGGSTGRDHWKLYNFKVPSNINKTKGEVRIVSYQINNDWIKTIRSWNQPKKTW